MNNIRLSSWRNPERGVRIEVKDWIAVADVGDQYISYDKSLSVVWNYLWHYGLRAVINKVWSRLREKHRNNKVAAVGTGCVIAAPDSSSLSVNDYVVFFAPNHPLAPDTICLDVAFVHRFIKGVPYEDKVIDELIEYRGWSQYSEIRPNENLLQRHLSTLSGRFKDIDCTTDKESHNDSYVVNSNKDGTTRKPSAVLFGLGNYAKTVILPSVKSHLNVQKVHDIDPDQLRFFGNRPHLNLDTSPVPRSGEVYDVWLVAGFHHTHAPIAMHALRHNAYAVVEKPLATTLSDYQNCYSIVTKMEQPKLFTCFHKRYSKLHEWAVEDLDLQTEKCVDMHCIVFEIPLPKLHWYNWPSSGSRILSNGCHWIDYFLFINQYSKPVEYLAQVLRGKDVAIKARLENGAQFTMSLTDRGSKRLGVRDHIELRIDGTTVTMVDGTRYQAENNHRIIRRRRTNPITAYQSMYKTIARRIRNGESGDTVRSLRSSRLTLDLEQQLNES